MGAGDKHQTADGTFGGKIANATRTIRALKALQLEDVVTRRVNDVKI